MNMQIKYRRDLWLAIHQIEGAGGAEIGVAEGFFSADMLKWAICLPRLYMVDRWKMVPGAKGDSGHSQQWHDKNLRDAQQRVAPFGERAVILQGESVEMAKCVLDQTLAIVYVDADHSFEGVTRDIKAWYPKVVPGGIMAFHDYQAPQYGVKQAVRKFCTFKGFTIHEIPEDKPEDAGAWFRC